MNLQESFSFFGTVRRSPQKEVLHRSWWDYSFFLLPVCPLFFIYKELNVNNPNLSNSGYALCLPNWLDKSENHHTLGISRSPTLLSSSSFSLAPSFPLSLSPSLSYCGGLQCSPSPDWSAVIGLTLFSSPRGGISFSSASVVSFWLYEAVVIW